MHLKYWLDVHPHVEKAISFTVSSVTIFSILSILPNKSNFLFLTGKISGFFLLVLAFFQLILYINTLHKYR